MTSTLLPSKPTLNAIDIVEEELQTEELQENICRLCREELPLSDWASKPIVQCPYCGTYNNNTAIIESQPELYAPIPVISLRWVRFQERICFATKALTMLALGIKDSGKSSLLETFAVRYNKIIDIYGSSDMEALAWCKLEFKKVWYSIHGSKPSILLVIGDHKEVASKFSTCHVDELNLQIIEDHDVVTTVEQFFDSEDEYFTALARIVNVLWKQRNFWTEPWYVMVREASNWIYSRNKVVKNDNFAKAEFIKAMRESRHHGLSMAVDCLRFTSLDKEVRDLSDYTWIKKTGAAGLPDDLRWLYKIFTFFSFMQMKPRTFAVSTASGSVGFGVFDYPSWHKTEHEDILKICQIEIRDSGDYKVKKTEGNLGRFEHANIIKVYMENKNMNLTATAIDRSFKTVYNHVKKHNDSIQSLGQCSTCFEADVPFSKIPIIIARAGRPRKEKFYKELVAK